MGEVLLEEHTEYSQDDLLEWSRTEALRFEWSMMVTQISGNSPCFQCLATSTSTWQSRRAVDVYHASKSGGKWESAGFRSGKLWGAVPRACPSPGVPGARWELGDVGQAPPELVAAPEVQHSWLFLWLLHSQLLPCAPDLPLPSL